MQWLYRMFCYHNQSFPLETSFREISGIYRGLPWRKPIARNPAIPYAIAQLKYRGTNYLKIIS